MSDRESRHAFGGPGISPRWTSSMKEGVGTAYSTASRVWFTTSHGILNEIYYPTIDHPQVRDMELLVTDGHSFLHEEKRNLRTRVDYVESGTLGYRITNSDRLGRYRLNKEVIADPHSPCVLMRVSLEGRIEWVEGLSVFVLLAPHLGVSGKGNSGHRHSVSAREVLVAWKDSTYLALGADVGFVKTSCGYVGFSDGYQDLREDYTMDWTFESVEDGNIALMGQLDLSRQKEFTIGLAFGDSHHAAVTTLEQSLAVPYERHRKRFVEQWHRTCCSFRPLEGASSDEGRLYRVSRSLLLAHEDKTFAGAMIASASIPWGDEKGDEDIGGYHLVWTRDLVQSATALLACDDLITPCRALVYIACSQRPDGGFPQNFWIDGRPYWSGIQLDEVAFPILLAWRLWKAGALKEFDPFEMVRRAAGFLIRRGPATQQERWEENSGYSPSTLASNIAALICAADFVRDRGDDRTAAFLEEYADFLESHVERWTVTTQGSLLPDVSRHYIRIHPTDIDDPSPDEDPNHGRLRIKNQRPDQQSEFPAKEIVDAGFLELVRYGIRKAGDPLIEDSLKVIDAVLKVDTPYGPCWHRYNHDGYGEQEDGRAFDGAGRGRAWPLLTGERGHYELAAGRGAAPYIKAIESFALQGGMLPEQIWDERDIPARRKWFGRPTGGAMPLMWSHAEYIKLLRSASDGRIFDVIPLVAERYGEGHGRKNLEVWKPVRQVKAVARGGVLRVLSPEPFVLHWTRDEWETFDDTTAALTELDIAFVDIEVASDQQAPVRFTFYWPDCECREDVEHVVRVE